MILTIDELKALSGNGHTSGPWEVGGDGLQPVMDCDDHWKDPERIKMYYDGILKTGFVFGCYDGCSAEHFEWTKESDEALAAASPALLETALYLQARLEEVENQNRILLEVLKIAPHDPDCLSSSPPYSRRDCDCWQSGLSKPVLRKSQRRPWKVLFAMKLWGTYGSLERAREVAKERRVWDPKARVEILGPSSFHEDLP